MWDWGFHSRRRFLQGTAGCLLAPPWLAVAGNAHGAPGTTTAAPLAGGLQGRLYKTLKRGMVKVTGSWTDVLQAVKLAGFDGLELDSPGIAVDEVRKAIAETGLPVDGTVCGSHWSIRHSSPQAGERATALEHLRTALRETHAVGGHSVLLVVGHGKDGPEDVIWRRSIDNIAQAVPLAAQLGVAIVIENVWTEFLYDHAGGTNQTADKFARYVDEFQSPWVGMQFDIGNHWKYGDPAAWIRTLGKRIIKLDVKGFSRVNSEFTPITGGDIEWGAVRQALLDIGYFGWVAAEVEGGGPQELRQIAQEMDQVFGLSSKDA